jgi:steroid 5-alpha reductase family enzyme
MDTQKSLIGAAAALVIGLIIGAAGSHQGQSIGGIRLFLLLVLVAYIVQWVVFVPSFINRTEHFFDLTGSLTYQGIAVLALVLADDLDARSVILGLMVLVWAMRLGYFLFQRVRAAGGDSRFDKMKHDWAQFLMTWTIQGLWITFTAGAALAAITSGQRASFGVIGVIGVIVWLIGFGFEAVADRQKSAFRADPANKGRFITTGLWSRSRHPNYFGEILLWVGVAIVALPALQGWQYITLISPVFVFLLLTRISGLPMLERSADKKWGGQSDYEAYKSSTPVLFPRLGS